ncbi:hypothetical protein [Streptomyces silvensis]|uniref:Uncharacterized protein n=1 Tax=Streptomyces silvensis TaxID=1765722 RepID=A0A0W7X651_9ACTN|nr:hypothetical protein [Streptomyces silvensis]KUF18409.1 hypothetical protein AT728_18850 [Streptomyces silvensis]
MTLNPTDLPGRTSLTSTIHLPFAQQMQMLESNRLAVETECNVYGLPAGARMEAAPDVVRILATDVETLGHWLDVRGGTVTVARAGDGVQVWCLRTATEAELPKFPPVTVLVSVLVTDDEQMMPEIRAAVAV